MILNNQPLFWVETATHLGHEFDSTGKQGLDCKIKQATYIGETVEILGLFEHAHPLHKITAIQTYACSFYGSNLFDFFGTEASSLYKAYNVSVRDAWLVPRHTKTYIVDNMLCGPLPHIKQAIMRRYVRFLQNLLHSEIPVIHDLTRTLSS